MAFRQSGRGWITCFLPGPGQTHVTVDIAEQWRKDFVDHLAQLNQLSMIVYPNTMVVGGMGAKDALEGQLKALLESHGIPLNAAEQRTHTHTPCDGTFG